MAADLVSLLIGPANQPRVLLGTLSQEEKGDRRSPFLQSVQQLLGIDGMRSIVKGQSGQLRCISAGCHRCYVNRQQKRHRKT